MKRKFQELVIDLLSSFLKAALALFLRTRSLLLGCCCFTLLSPCCLEACALVIKAVGLKQKNQKTVQNSSGRFIDCQGFSFKNRYR
jgi:hypothetical protein